MVMPMSVVCSHPGSGAVPIRIQAVEKTLSSTLRPKRMILLLNHLLYRLEKPN
jgi:hypothetical protein